MADKLHYQATGRRKTAVARVRLLPGKGAFQVNKKTLDTYFPVSALRDLINQPLKAVKAEGRYDIIATIQGGGTAGQAGALRHGLSRALAMASDDNRKILNSTAILLVIPV